MKKVYSASIHSVEILPISSEKGKRDLNLFCFVKKAGMERNDGGAVA